MQSRSSYGVLASSLAKTARGVGAPSDKVVSRRSAWLLGPAIERLEYRFLLSGVTTLANFSGSDGIVPTALVVSGSTIYGVAGGGNNGDGEVFSVPITGGTPNVLGSFYTSSTGNGPNSLVISGNTIYGTTASGGANGLNAGVVFSLPIGGGTPTVIASLTGTNGYEPDGVTISGSTLYVTTLEGGPGFDVANYDYGFGVIFSLPLSGGTPNVLASFDATDGDSPDGGLIVSGSSIYGVAEGGGSEGQLGAGAIFSLPTSGGTINDLTIFTGSNGGDGEGPNPNIVLSGSTIYGAAYAGSEPFSSGNYGEVFSLPVAGGTPSILGSFNGPDGAQPLGGVSLSGSTLYGTTQYGGGTSGNNGKGNIFSLPITGGTPATLATFDSTTGNTPVSFVLSGSTLYGTTQYGGTSSQGTVYSVAIPATTPAWLSSGSQATWNPSTKILNVTGASSIIADPGTDEPIVEASGSAAVVTIDPASGTDIHLGGLSLTNGATATVTSLGAERSLTNYHLLVIGTPGATAAPTYTIDSTSTLDLADNDMAILYGSGTSPLATVTAQLSSAYDNKHWDKPGLTSSVAKTEPSVTALGFGEASTLGVTTFDGLTLGGKAVLVKYTLVGDTFLKGTVGLADYNKVIANLNVSGQTWTSGAYDYTGTVGLADYNDILANFNQSLANVLPGGAGTPSVKTAVTSKSPTRTRK